MNQAIKLHSPADDEVIEVTQLEAANVFSIGEKYLRPHAKAAGARLRRDNRVNYDLAKLAPYLAQVDPERWGVLDVTDRLAQVRADQKPAPGVADAPTVTTGATQDGHDGHDGRSGHASAGATGATGTFYKGPTGDGAVCQKQTGCRGDEEPSCAGAQNGQPPFSPDGKKGVVVEPLAEVMTGLQRVVGVLEAKDSLTAMQVGRDNAALARQVEGLITGLAGQLLAGRARVRRLAMWVTVATVAAVATAGGLTWALTWGDGWRSQAAQQQQDRDRLEAAQAVLIEQAGALTARLDETARRLDLSRLEAARLAEQGAAVQKEAAEAQERLVTLTALRAVDAEARADAERQLTAVRAELEQLRAAPKKESEKDLPGTAGNGKVGQD